MEGGTWHYYIIKFTKKEAEKSDVEGGGLNLFGGCRCIILGEEPVRWEEGKGSVAEGDDESEGDRRRRLPAEADVCAAALAPCHGGVAFVCQVHHLRRYGSRRNYYVCQQLRAIFF